MVGVRASGVALVALATIVSSSLARADDAPSKDQCVDAYEQAQRLRKEDKLRAAREKLVACAAGSCPSFVSQDCTRWLAEVEASTPTIVVLAKRADGSAIEGAQASLDGAPLAGSLDGRAVPVDPGPHELHCEANGAAVDEHIVVAEGVKDQPFFVQMGSVPAPAPPPAPAPVSTPQAPEAPSARGHLRIPTATWVLGGVAAAGAVSFAVFGLMGRSAQSCAPGCTQSQVGDLRRDYLIADVSWITGLLAAGAAIYFALTAPPGSAPSAPATTAIRW